MDLLLHDAAAAIERDATTRWRDDLALDARFTGLGNRRDRDDRAADAADGQASSDR